MKRLGRLFEPSTSTSSKSRATRPRAGDQRMRATCCITVCAAAVDHHGHRPGLVVDGAALAGVVGPASRRRRSSRGRRSPASPGRRGRTALRSLGANQSRPSQPFIAVARLRLAEQERQLRLRLDLPADPGVGDDRRGAERAFPGVQVGVELDLRAAARALDEARLLHLRGGQAVLLDRAQVELGDRAARLRDRLLVAAVLAACSTPDVRREAQVRRRRSDRGSGAAPALAAPATGPSSIARAQPAAGGGGGALKRSASSLTSRPRCQSGPPGVQSQLSPVDLARPRPCARARRGCRGRWPAPPTATCQRFSARAAAAGSRGRAGGGRRRRRAPHGPLRAPSARPSPCPCRRRARRRCRRRRRGCRRPWSSPRRR